jgi:hypothetical protein
MTRLAAGDLDRPRLHRLGDLADQLDMEEAVIEAGADHLDRLGELEAALEGAARNAAVEVLAGIAFQALAGDEERVLLDPDVDVVGAEARDRHRQAVGIVAGLLDVVGRIRGNGVGPRRIDDAHQPIETDGGTEKRGKVESRHDHILH